MQTARKWVAVAVEDYLVGERTSEVRHEYIGGVLHAMAGASREHNIIAGNLFAALHSHLRGKSCRVYMADLKVRLQIAHSTIFYYPDLVVTCDPRDTDRYASTHPRVLIEVLSPETERIDRREKFLSYTQIETLEEYILVSQETMEVTLYHRKSNWQPEILRQPEHVLRINSLELNLPLGAIYEGLPAS